tara:strand:- start:554 stop:1153 length:600 start_codon:yes stop_codon:yes gene_type:complete
MTENDIDTQIKEHPLTKEEAREQFIRHTEELGIKHTFSFDEAWEIGEELRKKKEYRLQVVKAEEEMLQLENVLVGDALHTYNPIEHTFAGGCYVRKIFNPADQLLVTKIHKQEHPFFLMEGSMSILTEDGVVHLNAPYHGITKPGTKRIIYTHTDCVFITVHATDKKTPEEVEEDVIAKDFNDPVLSIEEINLLKKITT